MVLPVLVIAWAAGMLQDAKQSTRAVAAAFYVCMFVRGAYEAKEDVGTA